MTPLAHRIVRELTLPVKERTIDDRAGLLGRMADIHCFEVTDIVDAATSIAATSIGHVTPEVGCFLPAPRTWLEWRAPHGRHGFLLEEEAGRPSVFRVTASDDDYGKLWSFDRGWFHPLKQASTPDSLSRAATLARVDPEGDLWVRAVLSIINTPRIIGRRQHMPHRGLERKLVARQKVIGKFPLHAWTEIRLEITPPKDMSGADSAEAHLTGQRALHFCRAHLRVRMGKLEVVRAHWRGDASLGIKQSRYRLTNREAA